MTLARKLCISALVVGVLGVAAGGVTYSAFSRTTESPGNRVSSGTVSIGDNDSGSSMLSLSNAQPGATSTGCIRTTYTGSLPSQVRLYGTVSGGLTPYLTVTVTRGTDPTPSFPSCTGFTAESTDYIGQGAGVVYRGPLSDYPASFGAGIVDPRPAAPETWTSGEARTYRIEVSLDNNLAAQGQSASAEFSWEARNQ